MRGWLECLEAVRKIGNAVINVDIYVHVAVNVHVDEIMPELIGKGKAPASCLKNPFRTRN